VTCQKITFEKITKGQNQWSRSADSTVAERIRERSLLLDNLEEYTNSSERSCNSWVCWTRPITVGVRITYSRGH